MSKSSFNNWIVRFWWLLPLATILFSIASSFASDWNITIMLIFCGLATIILLLQLLAFVTLLIEKRWWRAVGAFFSGALSFIFFVGIPIVNMFFSSMPDDFGKKHVIPEGMEMNIPITDANCSWNATDGFTFTPVDIDSTDSNSWLQIWNGEQGGIYHYAFYWPALSDGEIYLRCFEATKDTELSASRLKPRTTVRVFGHNEFGQVVPPTEFT
ncbi:MAG: hypothetical protein II859_04435, partial [Bacteroidales bacterium]|nr:hypothetical protein [Bacteroidales bacterium]